MRAVVTGVAGFIGSHLAEALIERGDDVLGIDSFTPYYSEERKRNNLGVLIAAPSFRLVESDLRTTNLEPLVAEADIVYHQAAEPGVRPSWSEAFPLYVEHNVLATHRLLEAARNVGLRRLVYGSSSSVYGEVDRFPTLESDIPGPASPYGVTKLAAEHLCNLYAASGIHTVCLRYFSVYGPRQRPDMACYRLIEAGLQGSEFPLFGGGNQTRDFTFVSDVVRANVLAGDVDLPSGTVLNISCESPTTILEVARIVSELLQKSVILSTRPEQRGDVTRTEGSNAKARAVLGWAPRIPLRKGLAAQVEWQRASLQV